MPTAFFTDSRFAQHTLQGHPEHAGRLTAVTQLLRTAGVADEFLPIPERQATRAELETVHTVQHLDFLEWTSGQKNPMLIGMDSYVLPVSYELARLAVGGLLGTVEAVCTGRAQNGLAAIRPPGHHATPSEAMGFCLVNNIAAAARYAQGRFGYARVAIVDFDVHHGNGTQDIFYDDPSVLFISSHQSPLYPGTGHLKEIGSSKAQGTTLNIPVPSGTGDEAFALLYKQVVAPALHRFRPQLLLISAGFDAHWRDPLATLEVSLAGFHALVRLLIEAAQTVCDGRIVFVMEGGYDLEVLSHGILNIAYSLLDRDHMQDPIGETSDSRALSPHLLSQLLTLHQLG